MANLIAIDPGDVYTGVAWFETHTDSLAESLDRDWECVAVQEFGRLEFEDAFAESLLDGDSYDAVIYERFRLYEDKSPEQKGSEFETSQLIGVIKFLVRARNEHVARHNRAEATGKIMTCELQGGTCADPANRPHRVELVGQVADIKKPTAGILRTKRIKSVAKPIARKHYSGRDHVVDAELHGWRYILRTRHEV
jgi:hypothetical protein